MVRTKAGKKGEATKYISKAKAIRKLQLSLKDFRRLSILKGIYPRQPPKKLKKNNKTYYHVKDVNFMALDPLIAKIRSQKVYMKKYKKAKAKNDIGKIRFLATHKPKLSLNHLVRERYPDFIDALRDLDDPLSLMALFSIFPTHKQFNLSSEKIEASTKLLKYFELYVIQSHSLQKVFVSIKGIYYQVEIMGQKITYITPYRYPPNMPLDVDYRVMSTFLDIYITLLKFINFKLYSTIGLIYPPKQKTQETDSLYMGYDIEKISSKAEEGDEKYKIDEEFALKQQKNTNKLLFSGLHFYLNTEVPRYSLEYIILAMGGTVTYNYDPENHAITHVITDRQTLNVVKVPTKEYVQPQWVYDCVNFKKLLNVKDYSHDNKELPPHISPFEDEKNEDRYIPEREREMRGMEAEVEERQQIGEEDKYDIGVERKKAQKKKKEEEKEFNKISRNVMSNTNKKWLKVIEHGKNKKKEAVNRLKDKAKKLKSN